MTTLQNIPSLTENETVEPMYPRGSGARRMVLIGDAGFKPTGDNTVLKFASYQQCLAPVVDGGLGPVGSDGRSPLQQAVFDAIAEGSIYDSTNQTLGVDFVYVINVRTNDTLVGGDLPALTKDDWEEAIILAETIPEMELEEVFVGCYDTDVMTDELSTDGTKTGYIPHAHIMRSNGQKRIGFFTVDPTKTIVLTSGENDITGMTDDVSSSFVVIHIDPLMQVKFATKCACTPFYNDPAYGGYRSQLVPTETVPIPMSRPDMDAYIGAGIVVDWLSINPNTIGQVEPCMAVATSYKPDPDTDVRPADAYLHQRLNVDRMSLDTNNIAMAMIKQNDTVTAQNMALASITSYLQNAVSQGYIQPKLVADDIGPADPGFYIDLSIDDINPFQIDKNMKTRPIGAIYMIQDNEIIQAPVTGAAASSSTGGG